MNSRTITISNGSNWNGQELATIDDLIGVLETEPLDRSFEKYGNFIYANPRNAVYIGNNEWEDLEPLYPNEEMTRFFGNFHTLSHVFTIDSSEPEVVARLTKAICANQQRADYLAQQQPKVSP